MCLPDGRAGGGNDFVDRLGFHVRAKTQDGMRGARIGFLREARDSAQTRKVLVEMVQQARAVSSAGVK